MLKRKIKKKSIIDLLVNDEASVSGKTDKERTEEILLERYLRDIRNKSIVEDMYNQGIGKGLSTFWLDAAYREDASNKIGVLRYMIKLAETEGSVDVLDRKSPEFAHFIGQLELLYYKLRQEARNSESNRMKMETENMEKLIKLYRCVKQEGRYIRLIYHIINNNWPVLGDNQRAMFVLMDVALVQRKWLDTPETRIEFVSLLNKS